MAGQALLIAQNAASLFLCKWVEIVVLLVMALHTRSQDAGVRIRRQNQSNVDDLEEDFLLTTTERVAVVEDKKPYKFLAGILSLGIILLFCIGARIAYSVDYHYKKSGSIITLENSGSDHVRLSHVYLIVVDTGNWGRCGTSNHVRIEFHAKTYCSRVLCLRPNDIASSIFTRGHRDIFVLKTADCLGEILSLTLLLVRHGKQRNWFLECIKLIDVSHNQEWNFPCYRWLSTGNKTTMVAKLFPAIREPHYIQHKLQNGFLDLHTWASLVHSYNRLGRLTRLERLALCCSMTMTQLFAHVAIENIPSSYLVPESDDENYAENMAKAVVFNLFIVLLVCLLAMVPEYILRNSEPWGWRFYNLEKMHLDTSCLGCNPVGIPFKGDMAFAFDDNMCLSPWHNTLECEICRQKEEEERVELEKQEFTPSAAQILEPFMGGDTGPKIAEQNLPYNQAKLHEKAEQYTHFLSCWDSFTLKFVEVCEDFKEFLDTQAGGGKHPKLARAVSWILDAMNEIQVKYHFKKQKLTPHDENIVPTEAKLQQPCRLPAELLLPVPGCTNPQSRFVTHEDSSVARLGRSFTAVLLIIVCNNLHHFKTVCLKTYTLLDAEFVAILRRVLCTFLHAVEAFARNDGQLCKISNGAITLYFNNTDDFLRDYLQNKETGDYDFPECASITCHKLKTTPTIPAFSKDEDTTKNPKASNPEDDNKKLLKTEDELISIKSRIREYTELILHELVKNLLIVVDARRPLHTLYDFIQYKTMSDESQEWSATCVDFITPLLTSISCPLVKHALHYIGMRPTTNLLNLTEHFLKTLVMNASIQASCAMSANPISCEDWLRLQASAQCKEMQNKDEPSALYDVLVDLVKRCMLHNNCPTPHSVFCSEGRLQVLDKDVLHMMLDEGQLRTAQLATPQMIHLLAVLVEDMQPMMKQVHQFISHALVTFTEAQEENANCSKNAFLNSLRQRLLDLNFLCQRLLQKSDRMVASQSAVSASDTTEPPAYWSMPGYHHLRFLQKVSDFKGGLLQPDVVPPLSRQEHTNIQGIAFDIHKLPFSQRFTLAVYFYLGLQAISMLALIIYMTKGWNSRMAIVSSIVLSVAVALDVFLVQPIKVLAIVFGQDRLAKKRFTMKRTKKAKKGETKTGETEKEKVEAQKFEE